MGADRRIPGANRRDLRRSDQGRRKPNRTRIYPPIRGPLPSTTARSPRLNACPTRPSMRIVAPAGGVHRLVLYYFLNFFTLDGGAVCRCTTLPTSYVARRCTTFAVASVVVVRTLATLSFLTYNM